MITFLIKTDNTVTRTNPTGTRIMSRSKLIDTVHVLVPSAYGDFNMEDFSLYMEYISPITKTYRMEYLTLNNITYEDGYELEYKFPIDSKLTAEAGNIELSFTFTNVELDEDTNKTIQYVRKTDKAFLCIHSISEYSTTIPDDFLTPLDERLIKLEAAQKAAEEAVEELNKTRAEDVVLNTTNKEIYLMGANGTKVGDGIDVNTLSDIITTDITGVDPDGNPDGVINLDKAKVKNI